MKRLLCIVSSMDTGGAETFLMKMYRALDKTNYQMDFCVYSSEKGFYDDEIKSLGGKMFCLPPKTKNVFKSFFGLKKLIKENKYEYVLRIGQHSLAVLDLVAAKWGGAKKLVLRSSNSDTGNGKLGILAHKLLKFLPKHVPDVKIAPSTEAAEHVFGKRNVKKGKVTFLNNAICVDKFTYDEEIRKKKRAELGIENKFVIGHVGRFAHQKNHRFLLEVFAEIKANNSDSLLMLVGEGELKEEIEALAKALEVYENVLFAGVRSDVNELFSAMDVVVFPSFYEGMPNVIIEAQGAGLHCIVSDTVTKEANITGLVEYVSLNNSSEYWAKKVLDFKNGYERKNHKSDFVKSGYDIESASKHFVNIIFE